MRDRELKEMPTMATRENGGPRKADSGHWRVAKAFRAPLPSLGPLIERETEGERVPEDRKGGGEDSKGPLGGHHDCQARKRLSRSHCYETGMIIQQAFLKTKINSETIMDLPGLLK